MRLLVKNIRFLIGAEEESPAFRAGTAMDALPVIEDAWLAAEDGHIAEFGRMEDWPGISDWRNLEVVDAEGGTVLPCWCDSHTHTVFAATRESEFEDRIRGLTYEEIARRGGGILNSATKLRQMSEEELYEAAFQRLNTMMNQGTAAAEIKSGYGLTLESELKMLRVIRKLKDTHPMRIKATFLAAHALPPEFADRREDYVNVIINEWLPRVADEGLADFMDVFCERDYFTLEDTERLLEAGLKYRLPGKPHVNQFSVMGGVAAGVKLGARSVDHLEELAPEDIQALKGSDTIPVALPGCSFFLGIPYTPGRQLIDAGLPLALATDFNPGSAPSGNMNFVVSLACIRMKLTPREAFAAATLNGAYAMNTENELGSLALGKNASFILTKPISSPAALPYSFGESVIAGVWVDGVKR
jgi:imidazolonepropionase